MLNRVNEVQQLGSVDLPYLGYIGAKYDNKHIYAEIDVPYSGDNGENCDKHISAEIDVPYPGHNGEICADEHISAKIDVPCSGDNGENCTDEQISAEIGVPYSGHNGENCADEHISAKIDDPNSGDNWVNCTDEHISAEIDVPFLGYVGAKCDAEHWSAEIEVNGHATKFKLDTGAGVSVVSDRETWLQSENLLTTKQTLRGPGGTLLPIMGVIKARLRHREINHLMSWFTSSGTKSILYSVDEHVLVSTRSLARQCPRKHE